MENNRRSFLKKSAIAGVGLGTFSSLSGAANVKSTGTHAPYDLSSSPLPAPFRLTGLQSRAVTQENPTGGKGLGGKNRGNGNGRKGAPAFGGYCY